MSSDNRWILEVVPVASPAAGRPVALDLGGGEGMLRRPIEHRGYRYFNLDIQRRRSGEPSTIGDAHKLPFKDGVFDLVLSKDTLEHFSDPWTAVREAHRVLKPGGHLLIYVPFMHPFHNDDFYRYSPLGLRHMLKDFEILRFDSPQWVFTVVGLAAVQVLKTIKLDFLQRPIRDACTRLDGLFTRGDTKPRSFAAHYRVVARKSESLGV